MKRIIKLKGELAFFAVISMIIAANMSFLARDANIINKKSKEKKIEFVYKNYVTPLKNDLKKIQLNDNTTYDLRSVKSNYIFYVVNKNGDVILSNGKDVKKIAPDKIQDGKREFSTYKYNNVLSEIIFCEYLKDGYYLYVDFFGYTTSDRPTEISILFIFIIVFTLLSLGRINYIINIKRSIKIIAQGQLNHRVPLKYRNELRELAEDINHMASELEKEDEKRRTFLTNISHDLRTPLTSILGYLNMIKEEKYEDKKEFENYIDKINRKSLFLKSMLDDFFSYSKLSSKDIEFNKEIIYVQELIRQIVEEESPVFQDKDLQLSLSLSKEPISVKGDGELLVRAVNNLLSNALKYSKKNTVVNIEVYKKLIGKDSFSVISISNVPEEQIDEEEIESFFERLYKKDKSRSKQGSGLGLSIVKEILKIHDGYVKGSMKDGKVVFKLFIKSLILKT